MNPKNIEEARMIARDILDFQSSGSATEDAEAYGQMADALANLVLADTEVTRDLIDTAKDNT